MRMQALQIVLNDICEFEFYLIEVCVYIYENRSNVK